MGFRQVAVSLGEWSLRAGVKLPSWVGMVARLEARAELRDLVMRQRVECVLDVGGNVGQFARRLRNLGFRGRIISFEPISEACEIIREKARVDPLWTVCNVALGAKDGVADFRVVRADNGHSVLSSFLPLRESHPFVAHEKLSEEVRTVPVRRLDSVLPELLSDIHDRRLFLKMDTQGFDLEVVRGADAILGDVVLLQSELSVVPLYEGMPHYTTALDAYAELGFELVGLDAVNRTPSGAVMEYDCLMQRAEV